MHFVLFCLMAGALAAGCTARVSNPKAAASSNSTQTSVATQPANASNGNLVTSTLFQLSASTLTVAPTYALKEVSEGSHLYFARSSATATLLPNGKILIVGGQSLSGQPIADVELLDPSANGGLGAAQLLTSINNARSDHTATLLPDGKVLIAGGISAYASVELYDPAGSNGEGSVVSLTSLGQGRYGHTAHLLSNGKVILIGGADAVSSPIASVELYDPQGSAAQALASLSIGRVDHTSTLLSDGTILIAGGLGQTQMLQSVERYNPAANSGGGAVVAMANMNSIRLKHTATLLSSGKILFVGGARLASANAASVELYDPLANSGLGSSQSLAELSLPSRYSHSATLLSNGKVLIVGGVTSNNSSNGVELYDPAGGGSATALTSLRTPRARHSSIIGSNDKVWVLGGQLDGNVVSQSSYELYDSNSNSGTGSSLVALSASTARYSHTSTLLSDGKILIAGGTGTDGRLISNVELYDPRATTDATAMTALAPLNVARASHFAFLLSNGKVLMMGGFDPLTAQPITNVELYDPQGNGGAGSSVVLTPLGIARAYTAMLRLTDGKILIVGGMDSNYTVLSNVELYDPQGSGGAGSVSNLAPINTARLVSSLQLLQDGRVLIAGGQDETFSIISSVEVYDPSANSAHGLTKNLAPMTAGRAGHSATVLDNGKVLIAGGLDAATFDTVSTVELYDPLANSGNGSTSALTALSEPRSSHSATLLPNGKVLLAGGQVLSQSAQNVELMQSLELYDPSSGGTAVVLDSFFDRARAGHTANLLPDGRVWYYGGMGDSGALSSWGTLSVYEPVAFLMSGGTAPYQLKISSGTGSIDPANFLYLSLPGSVTVQGTDSANAASSLTITAQ